MMNHTSYADAYQNGLRSTIRLLRAKGLNIDDAEEVAQCAWVRGWEARAQLNDDACVIPWVNSIAVRTMFTEKRRSRPHEELNAACPHEPYPIVAKLDADQLLRRCSPLDRSLILHRYTGGFEMEEVARIHGMSCVAARVRIHRAKAALRRYAKAATLPLAA